ncbi:uncharacterized protein LOC142768983 [Rhipicephalus microplus]|uniref:uncharacterized protein LOC142768983 n=1 Tax=Rhipicephalus microplus TaxID=6941 RepID=UPI003F6C6012
MVAVNSSLLIAWLLMSFCKESFEVGGWIEDRSHNLNLYSHLAEFAYADQKTRNTRGMHFRVTQARWKYTEGMRYNIGFIVYNENTSLLEESVGAGGWTEVKDPDTPEYRRLARFAYKNQRRYWSPRLTFLVTQARWRITEGKEHNLAFVVLYGDLPSPKFVCYYAKFHPFYGAWHFPYPDGTPCWTRLPWTTGVCINGQCTMLNASRLRPCDGVYKREGYTTSCSYTCSDVTGEERVKNYEEDTPCIRSSEEVESIKLAGLCKKGVCVEPSEIGNHETKQAHPERLMRCKEKENSRKMVLWNCHYYCQINHAWYSGYYNSNLTSACHLPKPTREQPLGWCCRGECIKKQHCGKKHTSSR